MTRAGDRAERDDDRTTTIAGWVPDTNSAGLP